MYKQLLLTEFANSRNLLLLALIANTFFLILMGARGQSLIAFMGVSMTVYWILLMTSAVIGAEEKRLQLYAQLPLTAAEVSYAIWFSILLWLGIHVCFWLLYGFMFEPEFTFNQAPEIASAAITMALFVVLISIGLDLGAFKPGYLRWLYFGSLAGLLGLAMNFGFSVGLLATDDGLQIYPLALLADGWSATLIAIVILAIALAADHLIYINSDHYLR